MEGLPFWPFLVVLVVATAVGGPIFVALGGAAALLFMIDGVPPAAVPVATYSLSVSPTLAAIPLFTLAGFVLAEGGASGRLLRVFRALGRLAAGRDCGRLRGGLRLLHHVHRWLRSDDTGARGAAAQGAPGRRLPGSLLARAADGLGLARPAVSAGLAAHPLRHHRATADRGSVHRRSAARSAPGGAGGRLGRARGDSRCFEAPDASTAARW